MLEMIQIFLVKTPETLIILKQAIVEQNWEMVGFYAHKLKATYAYMGMLDLKELLINIEKAAKQLNDLNLIPEWFETIYDKTQIALVEISNYKLKVEQT